MDSRVIFSRSVDSMFRRLGRDARYIDQIRPPIEIRVIPRRPEQLFEISESHIHFENPSFDIRVNEIATVVCGNQIEIDGKIYEVQEEPLLDIHQLIWTVETLPV